MVAPGQDVVEISNDKPRVLKSSQNQKIQADIQNQDLFLPSRKPLHSTCGEVVDQDDNHHQDY